MTSIDHQPEEGMEDLSPTFQDPMEGGGQTQNVRTFLPGGGPGHHYFWLGDVGGEPTDGPHTGEFPPQGDKKAICRG